MKTLPRLLLPFALILSSCEPQVPPNLSPEAAAEFTTLREQMENVFSEIPCKLLLFFSREDEVTTKMRQVAAEMEELLQQYAETGDARLRTPLARQSMLHFAVQYRKEALVRELLLQGADPNATCDFSFIERGEMDAPLVWTVVPEMTKEEEQARPYHETAISLIDILAEAGARMDDKAGGHALFMCSISGREGAEDVYLHLLARGANPRLGYMADEGKEEAYLKQAVDFILDQHWNRALAALIDKGHITVDFRDEEQRTLLFDRVEKLIYLLRSGDECYATASNEQEFNAAVQEKASRHLATIRVLLEKGANPNAPQGGGWTPLTYAAAITPQDMLPASMYTDQETALATWRKLIVLLLQHGGDANATIPAFHGHPARRAADCLPAPPSDTPS